MFDQNLFLNKKVLITGNTGFKGSWLTLLIQKLGGKVFGFSLDIPTSPAHFSLMSENLSLEMRYGDIASDAIKEYIEYIKPDFIFHLAAQALVPESITKPNETMLSNVMGMSYLLNSLRDYDSEINLILITSDKVYSNSEWVWGYREIDRLGGKDPYSASKACAELVISSYCDTFFKHKSNIKLGIARAGNVIGGGDWSANRLIPDSFRAWQINKPVFLRNPSSTRPWQHVLEPIVGYVTLADKISKNETNYEAYNFGPEYESEYSVLSVIKRLENYWENFRYSLDNDDSISKHESKLLALNCDKAKHLLGWKPILNVEESISYTAEWYANYSNNPKTIIKFSQVQIDKYLQMVFNNG